MEREKGKRELVGVGDNLEELCSPFSTFSNKHIASSSDRDLKTFFFFPPSELFCVKCSKITKGKEGLVLTFFQLSSKNQNSNILSNPRLRLALLSFVLGTVLLHSDCFCAQENKRLP